MISHWEFTQSSNVVWFDSRKTYSYSLRAQYLSGVCFFRRFYYYLLVVIVLFASNCYYYYYFYYYQYHYYILLFLLTSLLFSDQEIQSNLPQFDHPNCEDPSGGGWGEGGLGLIFAGYVPLASQSPNQIIVYSAPNYRPHLSHFLFL